MNKPLFRELLQEAMTRAGISQRELARRTGKNISTISFTLQGKTWGDKYPPLDDIEAYARALNVPVAQLTGEDVASPMLPQVVANPPTIDPETASLAEIGRAVLQLVREKQNVIRQPWRAGGSGSRICPIVNTVPADDANVRDSQLEDEIDIPDFFWVGANDPQVYRVSGDCMTGARIFSGDTVIIDAALTEPRDGQIVIARLNGGLTLKHFHRAGAGIELRPDAPGYSPIVVKQTDDLSICGILHKVFQPGDR